MTQLNIRTIDLLWDYFKGRIYLSSRSQADPHAHITSLPTGHKLAESALLYYSIVTFLKYHTGTILSV